MKNILIIGAGAMGSAFSVPCVENNNNVSLMGTHLEDSLIETIKSKNNFHPKLNVNLPSKLKVEKIEKLEDLMKEKPDVLVVGVSSIGIDWFVDIIADKIDIKTSLVILTKGLSIVNKKLSTISDKIKIMLSEKGIEFTNISAIKGPCLAAGLAKSLGKRIGKATSKAGESSGKLVSFLAEILKASKMIRIYQREKDESIKANSLINDLIVDSSMSSGLVLKSNSYLMSFRLQNSLMYGNNPKYICPVLVFLA